jgi:Ni/Co efflux regulator RcnB
MAPDHPQYSNNRPPEQNYGGGHQWHDGDHYNGSRHEVDWRQHHLRQPPHGYEWVQNGNNYVLIAVASGVIASIIANAMNQ